MKKIGKNRILFITQWEYNDALIQTYTLPYIHIIQSISDHYCYLIGTTKKSTVIKVKKKGSIILIEVPVSGEFLLLRWLANIIFIRSVVRKKRIPIIHTLCTPAGSIGALLKMLNKKLFLVLDSVEPHAESMVESGTWMKNSVKFKLLFYMEKQQIKVADKIILAAEGMDRYIKEKYGMTIHDFQIKPACVDLDLFSYASVKDPELVMKYELKDKITCLYTGKLGGFYWDSKLFEFIKKCEDYWGTQKFKFLMLSNVDDAHVNERRLNYGISEHTIIKLFVPHVEVPKYMGLADFAVSPFKFVPSKRYSTPIKNGEYWALGLPIVITPKISTDSDTIAENNAGAILDAFDNIGYMKVIKQIDLLLSSNTREAIYAKIRPLAEKYRNFSIAEKVYRSIYD